MNSNKQNKLHYKMYKSGKKWIISGIVSTAVGIGFTIPINKVNADSNPSITDSNSTITSSASNNSSSSSVASSSSSTVSSSSLSSSSSNSSASLSVVNSLSSSSASIKVASNSDTSVNSSEALLSNSTFDQNFHYNTPKGYSNDIQTVLPHVGSNGNVDYYDTYYLYNPNPNQISFGNEWYHVRTSDFKNFSPLDSNSPSGIDNVAIPDPDFMDSNGNSGSQVASNNKNGIPWEYVATGSVIYNNGLLKNDQWGNAIDSDAKLAYFSSFKKGQQYIYLAYSNKDSQFHPYKDTPVLDRDMFKIKSPIDFRDPFIDRLPNGNFVSYVSGGWSRKMYTFTSKDGINWKHNPSDDVNLDHGYPIEVEAPIVKTINGQAFMFFSWHSDNDRSNAVISGKIDSRGIFKTSTTNKIISVDGSAYKGDTYAGNYANVDNDTLINVNWSGNWLYSPLGANGKYDLISQHSGSFTLPRLVQYVNGEFKYVAVEPNNKLITSYKVSDNNQNNPISVNTNDKLSFYFDNPSSNKVINLSRLGSDVSLTITNSGITINRNNKLNDLFNKSVTIPIDKSNISKLDLYVDNASLEIYIPELNKSYNVVNLSTEQNSPYDMTVNTPASIDDYVFSSNYPNKTVSDISKSVQSLNSYIRTDIDTSSSLSSTINSYASNATQTSSYGSLTGTISSAVNNLTSANSSVSLANSYLNTANEMSNDARYGLYVTLASDAYANASNFENIASQSLMNTQNTFASIAPNATSNLNGAYKLNDQDVLFINGNQVNGKVVTDINNQEHYYNSFNGYMMKNLLYLNNGNYYYFDGDGNMVKSKFVSPLNNNQYYYFDQNGQALIGNVSIDGQKYLFNSDGTQIRNNFVINDDNSISYYNDLDGALVTNSININGNNLNFDSNGKLTDTNKFVTSPDGSTYYLDANSKALTSYQNINGKTYYFGDDGKEYVNKFLLDKDGNVINYFDINGQMIKNEYVNLPSSINKTYYFDQNGNPVIGKKVIFGKNKLFDENGVQEKKSFYVNSNGSLSYYDDNGDLVVGNAIVNGQNLNFDQNGQLTAKNKLVQLPPENYASSAYGNTYYLNANSQVVIGLKKISGSYYYFNNDGTMARNSYVESSPGNNKFYYFAENGKMVKGAQEVNGVEQFFNSKGILLKNYLRKDKNGKISYYDKDKGDLVKSSTVVINGKIYYFNKNGYMIKNKYAEVSNNEFSYFNSNGIAVTGYHTIHGKKQYFDDNGIQLKNAFNVNYDKTISYYDNNGNQAVGSYKINGQNLNFNKKGHLLLKNQFLVSPDNLTTYYVNSNGKITIGKTIINGSTYYFDNNGIMYKNTYKNNNNSYYYFGDDGKAVTGTHYINGQNLNFNSSGQLISNNQFVYIPNGNDTFYNGETVNDDSNVIYLNSYGHLSKGFNNINGHIYGFDKFGNMYKNAYIESVPGNNNYYYFNNDGIAVTGPQTINGFKQIFGSNGIMLKNYFAHNSDGTISYYDKDKGNLVTDTTMKINGNLYSFDSYGHMISNQYVEILPFSGKFRYFNNNGIAVTGRQTINGITQYFDQNGIQLKDGFGVNNNGSLSYYDNNLGNISTEPKDINGKTYRFDSSGQLIAKNIFVRSNSNNVTYYLNSKGDISKGFNHLNGALYYFDENGVMNHNSYVINKNKLYYFGNNGKSFYGTKKVNGKVIKFNKDGLVISKNVFIRVKSNIPGVSFNTYYLNSKGKIFKGIKTINGSVYGFDNSGNMYRNIYIESVHGNDKYYYFSNNGKAVKGLQNINGFQQVFNSKGILQKNYLGVNSDKTVSYYDKDRGYLITSSNVILNGRSYVIDKYGNIIAPNSFIKSPSNKLTYYLNVNSVASVGFKTIDGKKYYFKKDGSMLINGHVKNSNGKVYYANSHGILKEK